jgi:hypothetical protein
MSMNDAGDSVALNVEIVDGKNRDGSDVRGQQFTEFVLVDESRMAMHKDGGDFAKKKLYFMCQALGTTLADFDTDDLDRYMGVRFNAVVKPRLDGNGIARPGIAQFLKKCV